MARARRARRPALAPGEVDVRSADPLLFYTGDGDGRPFVTGVPARDLSGNDLARVAWVRSDRSEENPVRLASPDDVDQETLAALRDELIATGIYTTTAPAAPADEPEG